MSSGDSFRRPKPDTERPPLPPPAAVDVPVYPPHAGPRSRADFDEYDETFVRCYPSAYRAATDFLLGALPRVNDGDVLAGEDAYNYMVELRQSMVDAATEVATAYDSETWLLLIRRLNPRALSYAQSGTMDYDGDSTERVAENLVGAASGEHLDLESAPAPTAVLMRLAKLFALAGMVDSLEGAVRSATRASSTRFGDGSARARSIATRSVPPFVSST